MRRRTYLTGLAAGLAGLSGCQGLGGDSDPGGRGTYGVPSTTAGPRVRTSVTPPSSLSRSVTAGVGPPRRYVLVGRPVAATPGGTELTLGFLNPPDEEGPARLWAAVENVSNADRTVDFGPTPPFSNYWGTEYDDEERSFVLVPVDGRESPYGDLVPDSPTDGEWVATDYLGTPEGTVEPRSIALEPGEAVVGEYALLRHPGGDDPLGKAHRFDVDWAPTAAGLGAWNPEAGVGDSLFPASRSVPSVPRHRTTDWFHRHDPGDGPAGAVVRPDDERLSLPADRTELIVRNRSLRVVSVTLPTVYKLHDGDWYRIAPWGTSDGVRPLLPGQDHEVSFAVDNESDGASPLVSGLPQALAGLDPGVYAVQCGTTPVGVDSTDLGPLQVVPTPVYDGEDSPGLPVDPPSTDPSDGPTTTEPPGDGATTTPGDPPVETANNRVALAAIVELAGPPFVPSYTDDVVEVWRSDGVATVRVDPEQFVEGGDDSDDRAALVIERTSGPTGDVIPEQLMQFRALRNGLVAFRDGVDRVVVETTDFRAGAPLEYLGDGRGLTFEYDDETYAASLREASDGPSRRD